MTRAECDDYHWSVEVDLYKGGYDVTGQNTALRLFITTGDRGRILCIPSMNRCGYISYEVTPYDIIGFGVENRVDAATIAAAANLILKGVIV